MSRLLTTVRDVPVYQDDDGRVHWISGAAIDADGANGLTVINGVPQFAYRPDDHGLDALANAGYPKYPEDYRDILVCDEHDRPIEMINNGHTGYLSQTAYRRPEAHWTLQERWLDAAAIAYVVVNPIVRQKARGIVLGCKARLTWHGQSIPAVVGDVSGAKRIGELSYAAAKALRFPNPSPRNGGIDAHEVTFEMWPGVPAVIDGEVFTLIRA